MEDIKEAKDKVENKNHSLNREEDKTNGYKLVNRKFYKNSFNNKNILFPIKKDKYKECKENKENQNDKSQLLINKNNKMKKFIKFKCINFKKEKIYRKDYYFKHFKAIFGKYIRNKLNDFKNKIFLNLVLNNFSTPNYYFIANPKQEDKFIFFNVNKEYLNF